ncbi:hypothetical protein Peur_062081 [Populus x canadensis]
MITELDCTSFCHFTGNLPSFKTPSNSRRSRCLDIQMLLGRLARFLQYGISSTISGKASSFSEAVRSRVARDFNLNLLRSLWKILQHQGKAPQNPQRVGVF